MRSEVRASSAIASVSARPKTERASLPESVAVVGPELAVPPLAREAADAGAVDAGAVEALGPFDAAAAGVSPGGAVRVPNRSARR